MSELVQQLLTTQFLQSALALTAPLAFAALGGVICERAGVINLALEGMLLAAAFGSVWASVETDSALLGVLFGMLCAGLVGLLHAMLTVTVRMNHIISGIAMNLLALGMTGFLSRLFFPVSPIPPRITNAPIPVLDRLPIVGPSLFTQSPVFYVLVPLAIAVTFLLFRTRVGLSLRTVGESARVASTLGLRPVLVRYLAVVGGALIVGLGGVFMALVHNGTFSEGMTGGKGFIAFAVVIFSGWRPVRAVLAALLFGAIEATAFRVQVVSPAIPFQFVIMLPHLVTFLVFITLHTRSRAPGDLGRPLATS